MKKLLVSDDHPIRIMTSVFLEYTKEGVGVDCGHIILTRQGTATLTVNFGQIQQKPGSVTLLYPGDVVMLEHPSPDFEIEYLLFTPQIGRDVFADLKNVRLSVIDKWRIIDAPEMAQVVDGMLSVLTVALHMGTPRESHFITVMQLRAFFTVWQACLIQKGVPVGVFRNRQDELFYNFVHLLSLHYKDSRSVAFYADKLCITRKYLSNIVFAKTGQTVKAVIDDYCIMQLRLSLQNDDRLVSEIAWEYNFSTLAFFSDYFKRHTGETPQGYRHRNLPEKKK